MIRSLHSAATARGIFFTHELPGEVQEPVLRDLVIPRVISFSMIPTLQAGDCLELGSADALQVGDVIVFRQEALFICHRIVRIENTRLYTRGDAAESVPEEIDSAQVVGRVTAIVRRGIRHSLPPLAATRQVSPVHRYAEWGDARIRALAHKWIEGLVRLPYLGKVIRQLLIQLITVDVMEQAPLRSLTGYIKQRTCRLSQATGLLHDPSSDLNAPRITLVFRTGPLVLAICRLSPWSLRLRRSATALGLDAGLRSRGGPAHIDNSL